MFRHLLGLGAAFCLLLCLSGNARAAGEIPCFRELPRSVSGICIREAPEEGGLHLGSRQVRAGDVFTAEQALQLTWTPGAGEQACFSYYPMEGGSLGALETALLSGSNQPPIAEDQAFETYKNLPNRGKLRVREPEGEAMQYALVREPGRGQVRIHPDGSFLYTPDKNKVGPDFFTYTASDPQGRISREARVTVEILKPTEAPQYADTQGRSCQFSAEWLKNRRLFTGEQLGENLCFQPDRPVNRGEFLTVLVKALGLPVDREGPLPQALQDLPAWFRPYGLAALRSGLLAPLSGPDTFDPEIPITCREAEALVNTALDQPVFSADGPSPVLTRELGAELLHAAFQET